MHLTHGTRGINYRLSPYQQLLASLRQLGAPCPARTHLPKGLLRDGPNLNLQGSL